MSYGILRATPDRWVREDGARTPHLQIRALDAAGQPWRIAVNVRSDSGSETTSQVVYWLVDPLPAHPVLAGLPQLPSGYSAAPVPLDYQRAPSFAWSAGRALPPSGAAAADDLQDLLSLHLQQCKAAGGEVYAFGAKFDSNRGLPIDAQFGNADGLHGIHNIHMNQGSTGRHAHENVVGQDGGLILAHPDRYVGLFLAFQSQAVPTLDSGAPAADAELLSALIAAPTPGTPVPPTPPATADVYLERALVNPAGDDVGKEVVVLANLATAIVKLDGWRLVDKNRRLTPLDGVTLAPGASVPVELDGRGVQLGNSGGNLILLDPSAHQADAVVYTTAPNARYVRFTH